MLQISDEVVWQETDEGVSAYHTETGEFCTLNETGARIWRLVDSNGERESIISSLSREYAGTNAAMSQRIRDDVEEFLGEMIAQGLMAEDA